MMMNTICIQLKNNLSELESVNKVVAEFAERHHLSSKVLFNLNLALEEILTNVISYGYDDKDEHQITVRLFLEQGQLNVEVEDDGRPFNPLEAPEPDLSSLLPKSARSWLLAEHERKDRRHSDPRGREQIDRGRRAHDRTVVFEVNLQAKLDV